MELLLFVNILGYVSIKENDAFLLTDDGQNTSMSECWIDDHKDTSSRHVLDNDIFISFLPGFLAILAGLHGLPALVIFFSSLSPFF